MKSEKLFPVMGERTSEDIENMIYGGFIPNHVTQSEWDSLMNDFGVGDNVVCIIRPFTVTNPIQHNNTTVYEFVVY